MTINLQLSSEDIESIARRVAELLGKKDDDLLDVWQAAQMLRIEGERKSISSTMSKLSNPKYTKPALRVHKRGNKRFYKAEDIKAFLTTGTRN